jgi:hypothetical protein
VVATAFVPDSIGDRPNDLDAQLIGLPFCAGDVSLTGGEKGGRLRFAAPLPDPLDSPTERKICATDRNDSARRAGCDALTADEFSMSMLSSSAFGLSITPS